MNNLTFLVFGWLCCSHYGMSWIDSIAFLLLKKSPTLQAENITHSAKKKPKSPNLLFHKSLLKYILKQWLNNNEKK